jgi:glycopeptide antibiotics resistance protein
VNQLYANFAGAVPALLWGGLLALILAVRALVMHSPRGVARVLAIYSVYMILVIAFWPHGTSERSLQLIPFDHLLPLLENRVSGIQLGWSNVALFVPFGVFVPLAWEWARPLWRTALLGAGLAFVIEVAQFVVGGHQSSVNDIILNTGGAVIGWLLMRAGMAIWQAAHSEG